MRPRQTSARATVFVTLIVVVATIFAAVALVNFAPNTKPTIQNSSMTDSIPSCLTAQSNNALAVQVEENPKVISAASIGSNWLLVFSSAENGYSSNLTTTIYHNDLALTYYSFRTASDANCQWNGNNVQYAMFVRVPINSDGTFNVSGLSVYSEPFEPNATAVG